MFLVVKLAIELSVTLSRLTEIDGLNLVASYPIGENSECEKSLTSVDGKVAEEALCVIKGSGTVPHILESGETLLPHDAHGKAHGICLELANEDKTMSGA